MRLSVFLLLSVLLTAGCSRYNYTPLDAANSKTVEKASYEAADTMASQAYSIINRETPLAVGTISDVNHIESSSALGRMISEQLSARFVQLGYNVSEPKLRSHINVQQPDDGGLAAGEYVTTRQSDALAAHTNARVVVSGTYATAGDHVLINVRMIDVLNAKVLAAHDYTLPMNADVRRLIVNDAAHSGIFTTGWAD